MKHPFRSRILSFFLCLMMALSFVPSAGAEQTAVLTAGDVNADTEISAADALLALQYSVELIRLNEAEFKAADVDGNDEVNPTDALYILQYVVELIDRFPADDLEPDPDPDYGFDPNPGPDMEVDLENMIRVTDSPYHAKGDGATNDRAAIQAAIDDAHKAGGGTVGLTAGRTFLTANLLMRSNVVLYFEDGAMLKQSNNPDDFVDPLNNFEPKRPLYGHDYVAAEWGHSMYYNYPLIYAAEGTENITITGKGIIEMTRGGEDCAQTMHMCPIGMYKTSKFEISDITIQKYNAYAFHPYNCDHGLVKNVTVTDPTDGTTDGFSMANCQDMRITGCRTTTGDDGMYIFSVYDDPRSGTWSSTLDPQPSKNYQIDNNHCTLTWDATKAFCFISWGSACPDQRKTEISNVYIHDNYFQRLGIWLGHWKDGQFAFDGSTSPMKNIRFENNEIGEIDSTFQSATMSDVVGFDCMRSMKNTDFEYTADAWWSSRGTAGAKNDSVGQDGEWYGYIDCSKDSALYQGIYHYSNANYKFKAKAKTGEGPARLFVRSMATGKLAASKEITSTDWQDVEFTFSVPEDGNYHIGIERGDATGGIACIDSVECSPMYEDIAGEPEGYTVLTDQLPSELSNGGGYRNELGIRFKPKAYGKITHARLYTSAQEGGVHFVSVWDYATKQLVSNEIYEWNILPGYEGWREFRLPEAVPVEAGKMYVLSVTAGPDCMFVLDKSMNTVIENEYLVTPATSGISSASAITEFHKMPTNIIEGWNFFRDLVFVPDEVQPDPDPEPDPEPEPDPDPNGETIFTTQLPQILNDDGGGGGRQTELGMMFSSKVKGTVPQVRLYTSAEEEGVHTVRLWDYEAKDVVSGPWEWDVAGGTEGWRVFDLPEAVSIEAGKKYVLSISSGPNFYYARTVGELTNPITNGNLTAHHGMYTYEVDTMPDNIYIDLYFRDIIFVPDAEQPEPVPEQVAEIISQIAALPETITLNEKAQIEAVRAGYNDLTEDHKALVDNLDKLLAAEAEIVKLEADAEKADAVIALIDALPSAEEVTLEDAGQVASARAAYNALTKAQKALVGADKLQKLEALEAKLPAPEPEPGYSLMDGKIPAEERNGGNPNELGIRFTPKTCGRITRARVYTSANESGIHYVSVWDYATGQRVSDAIYEWDIEAGLEGWREFVLPEEVFVYAGREYVLSVSTGPDSLYMVDTSMNTALENDYLITPETSGICSANPAVDFNTMPTQILDGWNFFRDVVFVPMEENAQTIFTDQTPQLYDTGVYELGTLFSSDVSGSITHVRLYTSAQESGTHTIRLWEYETGTQIAGPYEWDIEAGINGWRTFVLPEAIRVEADKQYVLSVSTGSFGSYARTVGLLSEPLVNGHLTAYGSLYTDQLDTMPAISLNDTHFRDFVFVPDSEPSQSSVSGRSTLIAQLPKREGYDASKAKMDTSRF